MFAPGCLLLGLLALVRQAGAHGRLVEPPSRFSAWRLGFSTPAYYNDSETNCGGFERHQVSNGGRCGICGDPWDEPRPRRVSWDFEGICGNIYKINTLRVCMIKSFLSIIKILKPLT